MTTDAPAPVFSPAATAIFKRTFAIVWGCAAGAVGAALLVAMVAGMIGGHEAVGAFDLLYAVVIVGLGVRAVKYGWEVVIGVQTVGGHYTAR